MSSPFNPLTALTPSLALPTPDAASPHPFLSPAGTPATPWLQLVNLAGAPGAGMTPGPGLPTLPTLPGATPAPAPGGGPLLPQLTIPQLQPSAQAAADADETLRAVPDMLRLLERAEAVRGDISSLEKGLFVGGAGAERAGALGRLEALQLDYAQTLFALISLSSTYLVGALPLNLSAVAEPAVGSIPTSTPAPARMPSTAELAAWTEARAQTMFARREAVRTASRAVGDVLKGVRQ